MAGTYHFIQEDGNTIAYDFDRTRQLGSDQDIISLESDITLVRGATATDNRIAVLGKLSSGNDHKIFIFDHSWNRISGEDVTLTVGKIYHSICATDNRWVVPNISDDRLEFWDISTRLEQTSERQSMANVSFTGSFTDGTYIYLVNDSGDTVIRRTYTNTALTTFISALGLGAWRGGTSTSDRFVLVQNTDNYGVFYNHSGTLQSSEQITLPSGDYQSVMAVAESDAVLTISTDETNLHTGKTFDIDITSDIDISSFVVGDVTVTGGTANSLTETDAQNWVLNVTAGSVGTMNVAIAQDVVSPGNVAVDQDFTIVARATVTIAFADSEVDGGDSADATVTFSESPTGLALSDFSVNVGTVDSISGSGTTRTVTVTAPSTGTDTLTLTLAEDSIDQGNLEASDSIDYAPADANLTVSTTDTPLYTGKVVDFDIVSDVDISDFTASDITVTGGTRGTLNITDAQNAVIEITLGAVGTLNISIAADAVSPGNVAVDEDFTIYPFTNLTGTGVRVGTTVYNSGDNRYFRGMASDGTNLYSFTRTQGRVVNTTNGTVTDSGSSFSSNSVGVRSATYHNSQVLVYLHNDDIYVWTPGTGLAATALIDNLTYASGSGLSGTPFFYGIASLDGVLYGADHTNRRLCTIASDGTVTPVGTNTYSNQITGLTAFNGLLLAVDSSSGNDRLGTFNTSTGAFTLVHSTNRLPDSDIDSMAGHDGALYIGAYSDGIYRAYDVKWDRDISAVELDEGDSETWDLSAISQDAASFAFSDGYTAPSWLTISGTDLVATNAESVESDTEFTPSLDAIRDSVSDTFVHSITVASVDTTTPSAPQNLTATADANGTEIDLDWDTPSDNGDSAITDYEYRYAEGSSVPSDTTWTSTGATTTAYTVTGLDKGTQYTFEVRAVNSEGGGTAADVTQTTATTVPGAPTSLLASVTRTTAELSWTAPTDDGGSEITEYQYRYQEGTTAGGSWTDTNSTDTTFEVTGLTANTEYTFQVRAVNSVGQSTGSNAVTETTENLTVPSAPQNLTATADANGTEMDLDWDAPSDNGGASITDYEYRYQEGSTAGGTWTSTGSTTTAYTVTGLDKGTEYTFQVRAVNSQGQSTSNPSVTETTDTTVPDAPTNLTATADANGTEIDLDWDAPTDDGGSDITEYQYRYQEGTTAGGSWTDTNSTSTSFTVTGLDKGTEYTFQVRTVTSVGTSTSNPSVTETTDTTVPDPPTNLQVTRTHNSATITWDNPTDTGGESLTDIELRITTGSSPGGNWQSLGVVETHTESSLTASTQYTVEVRAENSEGYSTSNPTRTFTTSSADDVLSIEAIDDQTIIIGTEDYELVVDIGGNPDADGGVKVTGFTEGFSHSYDADNGELIIKAVEVFRLVTDVQWNITLTKGSETLEGSITYSVVPAAPVIDDTVDVPPVVRGDAYYFFIPVSNSPSALYATALLTGIRDQPHTLEDGTEGLLLYGDVPEGDTWTADAAELKIVADTDAVGSDTHTFTADIEDISYDNLFVTETDADVQAITNNTGISGTGTVNSVRDYILNFPSSPSITVQDTAVHKNTLFILGDDNTCYMVGKTGLGTGTIRDPHIRRTFTIESQASGENEFTPLSIAVQGDNLLIFFYHTGSGVDHKIERIAISDITDGMAITASDLSSFSTVIEDLYLNWHPDESIITADDDDVFFLHRVGSAHRIAKTSQLLDYSTLPYGGSGDPSSIAVDDTYLYYFEGDTELVYRYTKSGIAYDDSNTVILHTGAIVNVDNFSAPVSIAI